MVMLGESVTNLALPTIGHYFAVPFSSLQWVIDGYNLTLSALILFGGSLGDLFGLRRMYLWSIAGFLCISLLCAYAWSILALICLRALLGIAGALLTPVSLALLNAQLPQQLRSRAIGHWTAWTTVVLTLGPLVGGLFIQIFSWQAIFLVNIPLGLVAFVFGYLSLTQQTTSHKYISIDWIGVLVGFLSLLGLTYGLIEGPALGWDFLTVGALAIGMLFFTFFVAWEWRAEHPLVDLTLFHNQNFSATNAATFALYAAFAGFGFVFAVFLQTLGGYSSTMTGAAFIPASILLALFSSRIGAYSSKWGPRIFMSVGPIVCALGMLFLLPLQPHASYIVSVLPGIVLFGIGLTLTVAPLTATALNSAPDEKSGIASAINNGIASVGPLIAIALLGLFGSENIYPFAVILCAALATLSGVISFMFVKNPARSR
jgi:EmrB/QacA subfamily drug resistance transporter